jgi:diguanylate cyclase (GGDEF)-like protein
MLLPLVALSLVAALSFDIAVSRFADAAGDAEREAIPLARLSSSIRFLEPPAYGAYLGDDPRGVGSYEDAAERTRRGFAGVRSQLGRRDLDEAALLARAERSFEAADAELRRLLGVPVEERSRVGLRGLTRFNEHLIATVAALDDTEARALARRQDKLLEARDTEQWTLVLLAAVCLVGMGVAVLAARRLAATVLGPVRLLRAGAARLGAGDLSHRVSLERDDELGDLAAAFDAMAADLQRSQDELAFRALHDPLTGLPNRALLRDRLEHALSRLARRGEQIALLMLDLDDFKAVNDRLGHHVGDRALVAAGSRLVSCVREADTPARLGGDEFAVLLEGVADEDAAVEVARRVCDALRSPVQIDGDHVTLGASIGVVVAEEGASADELLRAADAALYRAKDAGKGRVERAAAAVAVAPDEGTEPSRALPAAVEAGQLTLCYRPVVSLGSGRIREVTALPCWPHPERGLLTNDDLQPLVEGGRAAEPLTAWLLDAACAELQRWSAGSRDGARLGLGVSLGPAQLSADGLVDAVLEALGRHGVAPHRMVVGVSERTVVEQGEPARTRLADLRRVGVRVAVAGFGTGYSSLTSLRRTPVDRIAVDAAFVEVVGHPGVEGALAEAVVALARSLRLETVAEGVAHEAQVGALVAAGCRLGSGPRFSSSLRPEEIADLLALDAPVAWPEPSLA